MRVVIALGGNALGKDYQEQRRLLEEAVRNFIPLIKEGYEIVITHGNGPQVGMISSAFIKSNISMPLAECTAMSQGYIGFHIESALRKKLKENNINKNVTTIISEVEVDSKDPAFQNFSKPIGEFYTYDDIKNLPDKENYMEDAGRGWRKVVASPTPLKLVEKDAIISLLEKGMIVIAGGGGGIPVTEFDEGAEAVIDKDLISALIAKDINADLLVILTNVKQVQLGYNTPQAKNIDRITTTDATKYLQADEFKKGSMEPKVRAAIKFVENSNKKAVITDLHNLTNAIKGIDCTIIEK